MGSHRGQWLAGVVAACDRGRGRWEADTGRKTDRSYLRRDPRGVNGEMRRGVGRVVRSAGTFGVEQ